MVKKFTRPAEYHVFVTVAPTKDNGLREPYTSRVGATNDPTKIRQIVAEDLRAMHNTFGGLIDPVSTKGRHYRAFRASWLEIPLSGEPGPIVAPVARQDQKGGAHYQHSLNLRGTRIIDKLGFADNMEDLPDDYGAGWAFTIDGEYCEIWFRSPGGTARAYGPLEKLEAVFGKGVVS